MKLVNCDGEVLHQIYSLKSELESRQKGRFRKKRTFAFAYRFMSLENYDYNGTG